MADSATGEGEAALPSGSAASGMPVLQLGAYEGPLDLLLALARAQRVDLERISMLALAEQFAAAVDAAITGRRVALGQMGDWLVAAASLLALRARLLLPPDAPEHREAAREAAALRRQLAERAAVQRLAGWLEARPQLGRDVFERGMTDADDGAVPLADITELLRACLRLLERPVQERVYRPAPPPLWRVPAALAQLRQVLTTWPPEGLTLAQLMPSPEQGGTSKLQRRAALASTLMAGLELAREGTLGLDQNEGFGEIQVSSLARESEAV